MHYIAFSKGHKIWMNLPLVHFLGKMSLFPRTLEGEVLEFPISTLYPVCKQSTFVECFLDVPTPSLNQYGIYKVLAEKVPNKKGNRGKQEKVSHPHLLPNILKHKMHMVHENMTSFCWCSRQAYAGIRKKWQTSKSTPSRTKKNHAATCVCLFK
jgi:hypothetical protein